MLEQNIVLPEELRDNNFHLFLEDDTFVDYFNTFLALPCFTLRLYYNKEFALFEEFIEKLADDVGEGNAASAYQLNKLSHFKGTIYNVANNQPRIGYYVMTLDKLQGMAFVKSFRLPSFLQSELYAEYKLTMILSTVQSSLLGDFGMDEDFLSISGSDHPGSRVRSAVSFNLDSSEHDDIETNDFGDRSIADSPHMRTIGSTFTAWQESFKRADSRSSLFSYTGGSSTLISPDITADTDSETSSSASERELNYRPISRRSSLAGISSANSSRREFKVNWDRGVANNRLDTTPGDAGGDEVSQSIGDAQEDVFYEESKDTPKDNLVEMDDLSSQNGGQILDDEEQCKLDNNEKVDPDNDEHSLEQTQDGCQKEKGENKTSQEESTQSTFVAAQEPHSHDVENEEEQPQMTDSHEEQQQQLTEHGFDDTNQDGHENIFESSPGCQNEVEELGDEKLSKIQTDRNTLSSSEISSEVSIPIIVSDETVPKTVLTTDSMATRSEVDETSFGETLQVTDGEPKDEHSDAKMEATGENIPLEDSNVDKEVCKQNENKLEEEIHQDEQEGNETVLENEDDKEKTQPQSHLKIGEEDEAHPDANFDFDTASEYTLKGIRGILRRRVSLAATSVGFDLDQSDLSDDEDCSNEEKPYDLSTKEGLDEFKQFLLDTVAEKYLRFWIDVECLKYCHDREGMTQSIIQKYIKKGGLYELPCETVQKLDLQEPTKVTCDGLQEKHGRMLEPIVNYWCARFTMHQQRQTHVKTLEYSRLMNETPKSATKRENGSDSVPLEPSACGMSQVCYNKQLVRPQSSRTHAQTNDDTSRPLTAKHKLRAKSAHPRLIPSATPLTTNATTAQLQNFTSPVRGSYGFKARRPTTFSNVPTPDYISSVRLFINPIPTPDGKLTRMLGRFHQTAVSPKTNKPQQGVGEEAEQADDVIDALMEGLIHEKQTGGFFESFLHKMGDKQWLDCLSFWKSLQEYNALFFADSLNPSTLSKKAMLMYAQYVVSSGSQAIGVSEEIQIQVFKQVDPPYEELFDAVEDHALRCLVEPWTQLQEQEMTTYQMVKTEQKLRHIEIKVIAKRRQSVIHTKEHGSMDSDMEKEKISIEEANRPIPVPKDGFSFETLIRNRTEVEFFREFLSKKHAKGIKDLMAWTDMETFRRIPRFMEDKRNQKAKDVRSSWLTKKYFFGHDSPATREGQDLIMNVNGGRTIKERPTTPVITESQKFIRARIERRWLLLFKQTAEFMDRQKPRVTAPEIVEDVMLKRRLQRSEAAWKILNSRWVSSSRDVVALRSCLLNPQTCAEFKTFVALKGDTFESDVDFWLEVQKFKDLCHAHAQEGFIRRKVQAITDCFLNSAIAPELQIDIPIEMAEKLLERLTGRITVHPYIFREAQMTVFRMLFNHWKEFIGYRSKVPEGQTLQEHLDEKLRAMRAEIKAKREASERRRLARLSAERKRKEREEREKKRMEDLTSLFSIDTASVFYSEAPEDELNSWFYSKHIVEQERQEHIKRLKEQGLEIPPELLGDDKDEIKSRRSRHSSSKIHGLDSKSFRSKGKALSVVDTEESEKEGSKATSLHTKTLQKQHGKATSRRGSLAPSLTFSVTARRNSMLSRKSDILSAKDEKTDHDNKPQPQEEEEAEEEEAKKNAEERKSTAVQKPKHIVDEIQVIPDKDDDGPAQNTQQNKLLHTRPQKSRRVFHKPPQARKKQVPLDALSCISDYSVVSNIDFQHSKRAKSKAQVGSATPLTFKSLKDFTNSPEGAPLAIPLPLVRITSASNIDAVSDEDGSHGDPSKYLRSRNIFSASSQPRPGSAKRKDLLAKKQQSVKADVIVN